MKQLKISDSGSKRVCWQEYQVGLLLLVCLLEKVILNLKHFRLFASCIIFSVYEELVSLFIREPRFKQSFSLRLSGSQYTKFIENWSSVQTVLNIHYNLKFQQMIQITKEIQCFIIPFGSKQIYVKFLHIYLHKYM